ncbi:MAG TPA: right-handed parallel beta-helix repeat-containing protein [bacterium]
MRFLTISKTILTMVFFLTMVFLCCGNNESPEVAEIQAALESAEANGRSDTIRIPAGIYNVGTTLTYHSEEGFPLYVVGDGTGETILDGQGSAQIMYLSTIGANSDLIISNITFQNGISHLYGGGLRAETNYGYITIDTCEFVSNEAETLGGGAHAVANDGDVTISHCTFTENSCAVDGGGLNASSSNGHVDLNNSSFTNNEAVEDDAGGALLYTENGTLSMTYNTFTGNTALGDGGAGGAGGFTYLMGTGVSVTVSNNTFTNNVSTLDGAGAFTRVNGSGTVIYTDNTFSGNTAQTYNGGACQIHLNSGTLTYTGNTHSNNTSGGDGGGLAVWHGQGTMDISGNTFTGNATTYNGGGINVATDSGTANIDHNVFNGNQAGNVGGGVSAAANITGILHVFNNTFYGNIATADGGGLNLYFDQAGTSATCYNNIMWLDEPNGVAISGAVTIDVTYSDIQNGAGQPWFGTGCIEADPQFVNAGSDDFDLNSGSPCIDTGDPTTHDPDGTRADMGAFYFPQ